MIELRSAGGVVVSPEGHVLVVSQNGDSWSLPKGHVDEGENDERAARREVQEESGVSNLTLIKQLGTYQRYKIGSDGQDDVGELKTIVMFLFRTSQHELRPEDTDNPEARCVEPQRVAALLTHPRDKEFFQQALSLFGPSY